ncbi:BTAD domain-containing putative transcriptional regulator [Saccharothrix syringae]|uniref:BTAD domain-containing putative transcriptional regulator n=1 Tax=Saccharothrix syringae TaxID=103733 RepID=UPI00068C141F|nr:BTAD domain-containing putative transcriptional regulator [Saccharothrix syringae]
MSGAENGLRVQLLGPVRAWAGERVVDLGSARPRTVFAVLASRADSVVLRDELVAAVWGADAPAHAVGNLHTHVSALRRALEPEHRRGEPWRLLTSTGSGYRLHLAPAGVDAAEFARLHEVARRRFAEADPSGALEAADAALGLWRGEAMADSSGPFVEAQRLLLDELRIVTTELRAEAALAVGRHAGLVDELAATVAAHPAREHPRGLLMRALHACGRAAEALETYDDLRRVLVDGLGIEPSAELRRLRDRIADGLAPSPTPPRTAVPVRPPARTTPVTPPTRTAPPPALPVLAGREAELEAVEELVRGVAGGRGGRLWVEGELGIGKSSLVTAVLARAGRLGVRFAHAVAEELGRRFPLGTALECLDVTARSADPRGAEIWRALRGDQAARGLLGGGDPVGSALDDLVALIGAWCEEGPVVLAVDDLQWADEASVVFWHRLLRLTERLPLLLVGAARPLPHRADVRRLRREVESSAGRLLDLAPLDDRAVAGMIGGLVGAPAGPGLRRIAERAAGNPLYVREIADALVRDGVVRLEADTADVSAGAFDRAPRSLVSAVTGRLRYLGEATREVLRWAALLGGEFTADDLAAVLGRPVTGVVGAVDEAVAAGVLRDAGVRLAFRHPVIRQALYEDTPLALRVALHQQAAQALARSGAPVEHVAGQRPAAAGRPGPGRADPVDPRLRALPGLARRGGAGDPGRRAGGPGPAGGVAGAAGVAGGAGAAGGRRRGRALRRDRPRGRPAGRGGR